jgi:quinol monooxygenase YgiN
MAVGVIATLKLQPGKGAEFEPIAREMAAAVRANEPGNKLYQAFRSRKEPDTYVFLEIYDSEDALKAHGASEHYRANGPRLGSLLAGRPDIEFLDAV